MPSKLAEFDAYIDRAIKRLIRLENALPLTEDSRLAELGEKHGLLVITDASQSEGDITFDKIDSVQRRICYELLNEELSIYDPEVVRQSQLQRLILCNNLRHNGERVNGLAEVGRFVVDSLVFNASAITKSWERARATLHHELFHAIDYRDDTAHFIDPGWRQLNGVDYKYNDSLQFTAGEYFSDAVYFPRFDFRQLEKTPGGFLNEYATESVAEDKAVTYSWMIIRYHDLQAIMKKDDVVNAKVHYLQDLLAKFHPSFDEHFWRRVNDRSQLLSECDYDEWKRKLSRPQG